MPPGLVSETFAPCRSSAVSAPSRARAMRSSKAARKRLEGEPPGVADHGHHQRAPAALLLHVDGDAEVDRSVVDDVRLAVDLVEVPRHDGHLLRRGAGDGEGDQVGEGDPLAGLLELLAPAVERGDGQRAERRRGRDGPRLVHVAGEHRGGALDQRGAGGLRGRGRRAVGRTLGLGGPAAAVRGGEHVVLADPPGGPGAAHGAEVDAVGGGDPAGHRRGAQVVRRRGGFRVPGRARRARRLGSRGGGLPRAVARAGGDARDDLPDGHRLTGGDEDLGQRAGGRGGDLGVHLVRGDLHERLVGRHGRRPAPWTTRPRRPR